MEYLLDTNIVLHYLRATTLMTVIDEKYAPLSIQNTSIVSIVTVGEIKSLALQSDWGKAKLGHLQILMTKFIVADINVESIIKSYAEIDAFSQGKLKSNKLLVSPRNMGKNDLWIAATANVLNVSLLTTDKDFTHLNQKYISLELIDAT